MRMAHRLFIFAVVAMSPVFLVVLLFAYQLGHSRETEVREAVLRQSQQANSEMQRLVESMRILLVSVSSSPAVQEFREPECSDYLRAIATSLPQISSLGVIALDGTLRCAADMSTATANYGDRDYFKRALSSGSFVTGRFTPARTDPSRRVLPFAMPLRASSGETLGVVAAGLSLNFLNEIVADWQLPKDGSITIADDEGRILARNPLPDRFVGTLIPEAFRSLVNAAQPGVMEVTSQDGTERILGYSPATIPPLGIYISTGVSKDVAFASANQAWIWNFVAIISGLVFALIISNAAGRVLIRSPIDELIGRARTWARSSSPPSKPVQGIKEVEEIATALDEMGRALSEQTKRAQESLHAKELLMAELNHRVKNTLAVVQSIGTQTAKHSGEGTEFARKFASRLQALARTHDLLTVRAWDAVSLRDLIGAEIAALPDATNITVTGVAVDLQPELAVSMGLIVHELVTNAIKYGCLAPAGGRLAIGWQLDETEERTLRFSWDERCATPIPPTGEPGFGTRLITRMANALGSGELKMREDGLLFEMTFTIRQATKTDIAA